MTAESEPQSGPQQCYAKESYSGALDGRGSFFLVGTLVSFGTSKLKFTRHFSAALKKSSWSHKRSPNVYIAFLDFVRPPSKTKQDFRTLAVTSPP